ncbi:TPA: DUF551 domain-containing protein [Mannheimia haemolytica]
MNEEKYFSVDVSDETHVIRLHETLEQAKQNCLNGANEAYEFAGDMDDFESYEAYDLPYAVYGVVLGRAKSDIRPLTDEERESELFGEVEQVIEPPTLVENNGWISVEDRLPEPFYTSEQYRMPVNRHLIYYTEDEEYWFIGFGWYLYDSKEDEKGDLIPYWELEDSFFDEVTVTHWQPLPKPPKDNQ